ncbi:MAG: hypothetical protein AAF772_05650, partial [Acidobacteriota bacterium]
TVVYAQQPAPQPQVIVVQQPAPQPVVVEVAPPTELPHPVTPPAPRATGPSSVRFVIQPADARVYLDGRMLGVAIDLSDPVSLPPGVHLLEVEHPTLTSERLMFAAPARGATVQVDLEQTQRGRRTHLIPNPTDAQP